MTDILFLEQLARVYKVTDSPYLEQLYKDILILDPNNIFVNLLMQIFSFTNTPHSYDKIL